MSTGYGWKGLRQVCPMLLGARNVPERLWGGSVYTWGAITNVLLCLFYSPTNTTYRNTSWRRSQINPEHNMTPSAEIIKSTVTTNKNQNTIWNSFRSFLFSDRLQKASSKHVICCWIRTFSLQFSPERQNNISYFKALYEYKAKLR